MYLHQIPTILFSEYKDPLFVFPQQRVFDAEQIIIVAPTKFVHARRTGKSDVSAFLVLSHSIMVKDLSNIEVIMSTSIEKVFENYEDIPSIIRIRCGMLRRSAETNTLHDGIIIDHLSAWGNVVTDFPTVAEACFDMARRAMEIHNNPQKYHLEFRPDKEDK